MALLIGLFFLSVRYVHTYPWPMPESQLVFWLSAAGRLGIHDPDDIYIPAMMIIELIVTVVAYVAIIKLWRYCRAKRRRAALHG
jgi:heme/copper-type cytochrome/quinol oxidase subunit 2